MKLKSRRLAWMACASLSLLLAGCGSQSGPWPLAGGSASQLNTPQSNASPAEVIPQVTDANQYVLFLQRLAREQNAGWTPQLNEIVSDPSFNPNGWLGKIDPPGTPSPRVERVVARDLAVEATLPRSLRWDNKNGVNFTTPVRTQTDPINQKPPRDFGTCQAFATIGCLEAKINILMNNPYASPDLSEWYLYNRSGRKVSVNDPGSGWWADPDAGGSLAVLRDEGTVCESVMPYASIPIRPEVSNATFRWRVINPRRVPADITAIKQELARGPVIGAFDVYSDFYYLQGDVPYKLLDSPGVTKQGGHAICIVGWDDSDSSWIVRNSWGANWGAQGSFKIAYGQVGIESRVFAFDVSQSELPPSTVAYVSLNLAHTSTVFATRRASLRSEQQSSPALGVNAELSTKLALTPDASAVTNMLLNENFVTSGLLSSSWNLLNIYQILVPELSPAQDDFWYHPSWSRDGDKLAFIRERGTTTELCVYEISAQDNNPGFQRRTRVLKTMGRARGSSFSPDGSQILTSDRLAGPGGSVLLVNVADGTSNTIKQGTASDLVFAGDRCGWSGRLADGTSKILYSKVGPGPLYQTYVCKTDGSAEQLLRQANSYGEFSWILTSSLNPTNTILGKITGEGYCLGRHDQGSNGTWTPLNAFRLPVEETTSHSGAEIYLNPADSNL